MPFYKIEKRNRKICRASLVSLRLLCCLECVTVLVPENEKDKVKQFSLIENHLLPKGHKPSGFTDQSFREEFMCMNVFIGLYNKK